MFLKRRGRKGKSMSLIRQLPEIIDSAEAEYIKIKCSASRLDRRKIFQNTGNGQTSGAFLLGDNVAILENGIATGEFQGQFDMIYCDPPFFTRGDKGVRIPLRSETVQGTDSIQLRAYHDRWISGINGYLSSLALRLMLMRDALKDTGSIFVHLDWHASHVVKLLMDEMFGEKNFINEIIWTYKSGGAAKRHLSRKHDTILFYSRSGNYKFYPGKEKSYNRGLKPYHFKGVTEYKDETGWYTLVNRKDVWQIDMVGRSSSERLNYATQKPEALLRRLMELVTDPGDLCGDFYCGSGTLAAVAARMGRKFVCADVSPLALANAMKRPLRDGYGFRVEDCSRQSTVACSVLAHKEGNRVVLESFTGSRTDIISSSDREKISDILNADPFVLVDYWCVGRTAEDGSFFADRTVFRDSRGHIEREMDDVPEYCDSVWVTDIFGQTARAFLR